MTKPALISKLTVKSQTVIPAKVRQLLRIKPGDFIRYQIKNNVVHIEKLHMGDNDDDPFIAFTEWASKADDDAYGEL